MEITVELIKHLPLFSKLSEEEISKSLPIFKSVVTTEPNTLLFEEGKAGDSLFVVLSGRVEVHKNIDSTPGNTKVVAVLSTGATFGEMSLLTGETRSASVVVPEVGAEILRIDQNDFMKFMTSSPNIAAKLLGSLVSSISDRLRDTSDEMVTLYETGRIIAQSHDYNAIVSQILERMIKGSGASAGFVMMWNPVVESFECQVGIPELPPTTRLETNSELSNYWRSQMLPTTADTEKTFVGTRELGFNMASTLYVPFIVFEEDTIQSYEKVRKVVGVTVLVSPKPKLFTYQKINLLRGIADQVGQAIANSKLMADNDSRRSFDQVYVTPLF